MSVWTSSDIKTLRSLWTAGVVVHEIAHRMERTKAAVQNKIWQLDLPKRLPRDKWTTELNGRLCQMAAEGCSAAKIGAELGVTRNSIISKAQRLGIKLGSRGGSKKSAKPRRPKPHPSGAKPRPRRTAPGASSAPPDGLAFPPSKMKMVKLLELKSGQCRWPIGDPKDPDFGFCGLTTCDREFGSYCAHHSAIAYTGVPVKKRRAA